MYRRVFMVNHVSFCGILGKTTRDIFLGSGVDHTKITQDYYPFKNEFNSQAQQDEFIRQFPNTKEGQKLKGQSPIFQILFTTTTTVKGFGADTGRVI